MTATATKTAADAKSASPIVVNKPPLRPARIVLHVFLIALGLLWLTPLVVSLYASLRPFSETQADGFLSLPNELNFDNYEAALDQGDFIDKYWNTALILIPSLILTLFLASLIAFVASRYSWRFNIFFLVLFTAGNLLPPQIMVAPLFQAFRRIPLPEFMSNSGNLNGSNWAIILLHVGFQMGLEGCDGGVQVVRMDAILPCVEGAG